MSCIRIGQHIVQQLNYDDLQPGDLVCTYEAITTRPDLLAIQTVQKYASLYGRPELNKMFHFQVILDKQPRKGVYRVAHADGSKQEVVSQNDNFKEHHPGQALIVFRANNKEVQKEIAHVAETTSEESNGHKCKILHVANNLFTNLGPLIKYFKFENFRKKASHNTLKSLAQMSVDFKNKGRFFNIQGTEPMTMSCVQYVANVVNVAMIRTLIKDVWEKEGSPHIETIKTVFNRIKTLNASEIPMHLSHPDSTPASAVEFFLSHPFAFQTVGYLGSISKELEGPLLDIKGKPISISPEMIKKEFPEVDPTYAAKVLKALGILSDIWQIYPKAALDPIKLKTLESYLPQASIKMPSLIEQAKKKTVLNSQVLDSLPYPEEIKILQTEKSLIKESKIDRKEKTLKISLNAFAIETANIERIKSIARKALEIGRPRLSSLILAPLHLACLITGYVLSILANHKTLICHKTRNALLTVYERVRKNIQLIAQEPKEGLWINYSINGGKTWDQEPFKDRIAQLRVPNHRNLSYQLFMGPKDPEDANPLGARQSIPGAVQVWLNRAFWPSSIAKNQKISVFHDTI